MSRNLRYLSRCSSDGQVNNGRKPECNFEMEFDEGTQQSIDKFISNINLEEDND